MTTAALAADIAREEGREPCAYPDPLSPLGRACTRAGLALRDHARLSGGTGLCGAPWTIGVGHTGAQVYAGLVWTGAEIDAQLHRDIAAVQTRLDADLPWWRRLNNFRQDVLVQMGFQMGVPGLLDFRTTLDHAEQGRFGEAADAMLASAWARQTPARARRLAERMRTGAAR